MLADDNRNQGEHADRSVVHHDIGHANHDVADRIKEVRDGMSLLAEPVQAEAEHDGKEDDLKNRAFGKRLHRINRDDVE